MLGFRNSASNLIHDVLGFLWGDLNNCGGLKCVVTGIIQNLLHLNVCSLFWNNFKLCLAGLSTRKPVCFFPLSDLSYGLGFKKEGGERKLHTLYKEVSEESIPKYQGGN